MIKNELIELFTKKGFDVFRNIVDVDLIEKINKKQDLLIPHRAHALDHKYYPADKINECRELGIWWSQELSGWPEVQAITKQLIGAVGSIFEQPALYIADIITNEPGNTYVKPHIDSPYRFDRWWNRDELLGIQCIIPLCKFSKQNGGTGLLPNSHNTRWVVKDSYAGKYNDEFLAGVVQPEMDLGDALIYHPRTLHSTMPNESTEPRRALLIHITSQDMIDQLKRVDNIWLE